MDNHEIEEGFFSFLKEKPPNRSQRDNYGSIYVDYEDLIKFNDDFKNVLNDPDKYLSTMRLAGEGESRRELFSSPFPEYITIRITDTSPIKLREMGSQYINKLITVKGIINRVSPVQPMVIEAWFRCRKCGEKVREFQDITFMRYPNKCRGSEDCEKSLFPQFDFLDEESIFVDSQELSLQEDPNELPAGQIPRRLELLLTKDLVEEVRAGDIVTISGIIRINQKTEKLRKRTLDTFMEVNNIRVESKEATEIVLAKEDIEKITELSKDPKIYERLTTTLIPSIYGNTEIKKAILYLLFGGVKRERPDGNIRGEINMLLIGDPACAKSQLLRGVIKYAPRGIYTSGRGTSAAGLTAAVIKQEGGGFALEAGALILGDKGVVCIDEMDKMNADDRINIHEAMEQHTVSIAKAGIVTTLNARCAILGAANPAFGRYDNMRTIAENLGKFPSTLLSRFDLIFIMKDTPQENTDRHMAHHMLSSHRKSEKIEEIPIDLIKKYIAYARRINPELSEEAEEVLVKFYLELRKVSGKEENNPSPIAITPRQLEGLGRLAEAHARIALREKVTEEDARASIDIVLNSLRECGIDPETGQIDVDVIMGGTPKSEGALRTVAIEILRDNKDEQGLLKHLWINSLVNEVGTIDYKKATAIIDSVISQNQAIYQPKDGYYKLS